MVAVTLLHRKGYFYQRLDSGGRQYEEPAAWVVEDFLTELPQRVAVAVDGRVVTVRCWKADVVGEGGFAVPIYFLDTDLPENSDWDRTLTDVLYGGDQYYRLCQEVILGIGGMRMLSALGHDRLSRFHMNEGHASLLTVELLDEKVKKAGRETITPDDIDTVREDVSSPPTRRLRRGMTNFHSTSLPGFSTAGT